MSVVETLFVVSFVAPALAIVLGILALLVPSTRVTRRPTRTSAVAHS